MDLMQERKAGSPMSTNIRAVRLEKSVKNTRTKQAAFEKKINPALEKKENRVAELDKLMGKKDVKNTGSFKGKKPVYVGTRKKSEILSISAFRIGRSFCGITTLLSIMLRINRFHLFSLCHHRVQTISYSIIVLSFNGITALQNHLILTLLSLQIKFFS